MQTLDQKRAKLAWTYATEGIRQHKKKYKNLAKGAPALIMNSGLMPTLAFYQGKDPEHRQLLHDVIAGLVQRLQLQSVSRDPRGFQTFMTMLQKTESREYMRYTDEALELLKWIRQFVDAVDGGGD